jgi:hypothetical protein
MLFIRSEKKEKITNQQEQTKPNKHKWFGCSQEWYDTIWGADLSVASTFESESLSKCSAITSFIGEE